ncbi:MAG: phospholipid carrier-dependent glycosyltransferase [Oscillospiraceae bacterium]|jgi:4-amino-4-deoxy-L-arabinose transferase-like glycosyltransferase|nr:phospholipid carrier-dependent glycosyltransferase [Oscillospiraceae bacterium]
MGDWLSSIQPWMIYPRLIAFAALGYLTYFFVRYYRMERLRDRTLEWVERRRKPPFELKRTGSLSKADALPALLITLAYAATTFFYLGDTVAPQSFRAFRRGGEPVVIELKQPATIERVFYYTGLYHGDDRKAYSLHFSSDGVNWVEQTGTRTDTVNGEQVTTVMTGLTQEYSETFRWLNANLLPEKPNNTRFIKIGAVLTGNISQPLELGEVSIAVRDETAQNPGADTPGLALPAYGETVLTADDLIVPPEAAALFDEQYAVPERYDVMNSTHFDEIYHARTAYEHIRNVAPYERTHPPLGKIITSWGISLFGMTPFGWRFMPALFGVLMVPLIFILIKWLFNKTAVAACGTLLFAFDFMHFVQTRISTIDVYAVFFILCMYLFMYRYITAGYDTPFRKSAPSLILTGLSFGVGAAAKWVCVYAGAGLLVLYVLYLWNRARHYRLLGRSFMPFLLQTLGLSLASFIAVPGVIYIACYIPYAKADVSYGLSMLSGGFPEKLLAWGKATWNEFYENQIHMFEYHARLEAEHNYAARWYEWLIDWKPILYYWNPVDAEGTRGSLWAFTNPLVTWAGLGALVACFVGVIKRHSYAALFILVGYLSQLMPWIPVPRITFPYHYFPSMVFICLGVAYIFHRMTERDPKKGFTQMAVFTAVAVFLFVLFYPSLTGMQVPSWYPSYLLRWLSHQNWLM